MKRFLFTYTLTDNRHAHLADDRRHLRQDRGLRGALPADVHDVVRHGNHDQLLLGVNPRGVQQLPADLEVSSQLRQSALIESGILLRSFGLRAGWAFFGAGFGAGAEAGAGAAAAALPLAAFALGV